MTTALEAALVVRRGTFTLDVELSVADGEVVAVLGPNGAGKSTLLAAISGLIRPESGRVAVAGRVLTKRTASARIFVPAERRRIGLLSQDPLLFPHLSAIENIAFGQRAQGRPRADATRDAHEWLNAVGLAGLGDRRPGALSGGQRQRVAIARALAARPDVLLLDEPLAALDVQTAAHIRRLLSERLAETGTTTIVVTHDVLDAIVLADRCAIVNAGRIIDDGPKARVLGHPKTQFIAALAGVNLVEGISDGAAGVVSADGGAVRGHVMGAAIAAGTQASAVFSPSAVSVSAPRAGQGEENPRGNRWNATIEALEPSAAGVRIRVREIPHVVIDVSPAVAVDIDLSIGAPIVVSVDPADVAIRSRS
ncbi:MAG TPA: ABC transporter ATP-binding protein [Microbacteriaceae bacterium]|nr:ABC transporter ATP-binding protein [Microbacteriaceae bacterium]